MGSEPYGLRTYTTRHRVHRELTKANDNISIITRGLVLNVLCAYSVRSAPLVAVGRPSGEAFFNPDPPNECYTYGRTSHPVAHNRSREPCVIAEDAEIIGLKYHNLKVIYGFH